MSLKAPLGISLLVWISMQFSASAAADAPVAKSAEDFRDEVSAALRQHFAQLIGTQGSASSLKGKSAGGEAALAAYLAFEETGDAKLKSFAVQLAEETVRQMQATKLGVLAIKEKEKPGGEQIMGGGPPALGQYVSAAAYIFHREGDHREELKYLAQVIDRYPWNEKGWWSADIDVQSGESKVPMSKPSPVNKTAAVALAAGVLGEYVREIDPDLAGRLTAKARKCIYEQVIPAQGGDGFWHYSLIGKDPGNKDILGYFMLTVDMLLRLREFTSSYRDAAFVGALEKAGKFAAASIAPMTDPNTGKAAAAHATRATPAHYVVADEPKRAFQLSLVLAGTGHTEEAEEIGRNALRYFPFGNAGQDGAHAATPCALMLRFLK